LKVSFIAGLGGILYGFDMGIIAAALLFVRTSFGLSTQMEEIVVSVVLIGAMLGAFIGGTIADRIGRRSTLLWGAVIFIVGSVLAPLSPNVATLIAARALLGLAIGFTSVTAPVYVSELAPPQSRGMLIGLYQFALTVGIALAAHRLLAGWPASLETDVRPRSHPGHHLPLHGSHCPRKPPLAVRAESRGGCGVRTEELYR
jgi:MFS family permease